MGSLISLCNLRTNHTRYSQEIDPTTKWSHAALADFWSIQVPHLGGRRWSGQVLLCTNGPRELSEPLTLWNSFNNNWSRKSEFRCNQLECSDLPCLIACFTLYCTAMTCQPLHAVLPSTKWSFSTSPPQPQVLTHVTYYEFSKESGCKHKRSEMTHKLF